MICYVFVNIEVERLTMSRQKRSGSDFQLPAVFSSDFADGKLAGSIKKNITIS